MDLETFIVTTFCLVDDGVAAVAQRQRIRRRGPQPTLADSEVITMEVVGEWLGIDTDVGIVRYFRQHHAALFPGIIRVHRTTFARQAANLWVVKQEVWRWLIDQLGGDPALSLVDSLPVHLEHARTAKNLYRLNMSELRYLDYLVKRPDGANGS